MASKQKNQSNKNFLFNLIIVSIVLLSVGQPSKNVTGYQKESPHGFPEQPIVSMNGNSTYQLLTGHIVFDHSQETFTQHIQKRGINYLHEMCNPTIYIDDEHVENMIGGCDIIDGEATRSIPGDHIEGAKITGVLKGAAFPYGDKTYPEGDVYFKYTVSSKYKQGDPNWEATREITFEGKGKFTSETTAEGTASYVSMCFCLHEEQNHCGTSEVLSCSDSFTGTIPWKFIPEKGDFKPQPTSAIPPAPPEQANYEVVIKNIKGDPTFLDVVIIRDGKEIPVTNGMKIERTDRVRTGYKSQMQLSFIDPGTKEEKAVVDVSELSEYTVNQFFNGPIAIADLEIKMGEISANMPHNRKMAPVGSYTVKTPTLTASVRGTIFSVRHDEATNTSTVRVQEGTVEVTPSNTSLAPFELNAGQQAQVTQDKIGEITPYTLPADNQPPNPSATPGESSTMIPLPSNDIIISLDNLDINITTLLIISGLGCLGIIGLAALVFIIRKMASGRDINRQMQAMPRRQQPPPRTVETPMPVIYPAPPNYAGVATQPIPPAYLEISKVGASFTTIRLTDRGLVIGRDQNCEIVLNDTRVSRRHAQVEFNGKMWSIRDLGSTNGIYLNGARVQQQVLYSGDRIRIGQTEMIFKLG